MNLWTTPATWDLRRLSKQHTHNYKYSIQNHTLVQTYIHKVILNIKYQLNDNIIKSLFRTLCIFSYCTHMYVCMKYTIGKLELFRVGCVCVYVWVWFINFITDIDRFPPLVIITISNIVETLIRNAQTLHKLKHCFYKNFNRPELWSQLLD